MDEWRQQFDDLRQRRPDLAERVCRRLLMDLQRRGLVDLEALDELATALKLGSARQGHDPNRPKPQLNRESRRELYDLALEYAERHLEPEEITATILLVEKRMLVQEGARLAEDPDTPLSVRSPRTGSWP